MSKRAYEELFAGIKNDAFRVWAEFVRFQSVSAHPDRDKDCAQCAEWLGGWLQRKGFEVSVNETSGKPVIWGRYAGQGEGPRVIFYGHYDVQPADPIEQWVTPPFEPTWRSGRLYARGAQDNKGQLMAALSAVGLLIERGELRCPMTVLIEGEEEIGSRGLMAKLPEWRERLAADLLMICDTMQASRDVPAVILGLRGVLALEVELGGLTRDLHSGIHGGIAPNPAVELAKLLATLHAPDGSVAVDGFYEGVEEPGRELLDLVERSPFDAAGYARDIGVEPSGGERRFAPKVRGGLRPCLEVNGLYSGYSGAGLKTIIPSSATAKLSARIVSGQDPVHIHACLAEHLRRHAPRSLRLAVRRLEEGSRAVRCDAASPFLAGATEVLRELFGCEPALEWQGASIPVVADLLAHSGAQPLLVGFGLDEDNMHAPNESFSEEQFKRAFLYNAMMLSRLAEH